MERYTQWRDPGTGIAPFLPNKRASTHSSALFGAIFATIRFPVLLILILLFLISFPLVLNPVLRFAAPFLLRWLQWAILRFGLLIGGFWWISEQVDRPKKDGDIYVRSGSLITSNHQSILDIVYLAMKYDPVFVTCFPDTENVEPIGFIKALWRCTRRPLLTPTSQTYPLNEVLHRNSSRIVAVFPEGTTTNGRALLCSTSCLRSLSRSKANIYVCYLRYSPTDTSIPIPPTFLINLWNICSLPSRELKIRRLAMPLLADEDDMTVPVMAAIARLGRVRKVGLNLRNKIAFWDKWDGKGLKYK